MDEIKNCAKKCAGQNVKLVCSKRFFLFVINLVTGKREHG